MVATAHALIAGAIASSVKDPVLGTSLAFISHPFLDMVPHWDFGANWKKKSKVKLFLEASGDLTFGAILTYILFASQVENIWYLAAAVFFSEVWDMAEAPYWILGWKIFPFKWIYKIQSNMQNKAGLPFGIITQIVVVGLVILALPRIFS